MLAMLDGRQDIVGLDGDADKQPGDRYVRKVALGERPYDTVVIM